MTKCKIIATCLVNMGMENIQVAEANVQRIFNKEFPNHNFNMWNTDVPDSLAQRLIKERSHAMFFPVKQFIEELW